MSSFWIWAQFILCLTVIVAAGSRLARYGDLLGEKTRLGRVWIGVVALAAITSLPELATGVSSVTFVARPDLSLGDLFGSNLFNLLIIAVIDLYYRQGHVLLLLGTGIVLSAALGVMIIAATASFIFLSQSGFTLVLFGRVGLFSLVLFSLYLFSQYMIYRYAPAEEGKKDGEMRPSQAIPPISRIIVFFLFAALATVGAGIWLAVLGSRIAEITGFSTTFVGTLFIAACTSAPEIVVSISAVKIGALDMAIGNMVGSNLFNMGVVIFVDDLFYVPGPILQGVQGVHILTALFAILMCSIIIISITFRPRFWLKSWIGIDTVAIAVIYLVAIISLYFLGNTS